MIKRLTDWIGQRWWGRLEKNATQIVHTMSRLEGTGSPVSEWPEWHYGLDIMREANLSAGQFFPALYHLEELEVIEATWAGGPYPRRRMYRLKDLTFWDR